MPRGSPLVRQWNLLMALQTHRRGLHADDLADRLGCSKRQVQRDLRVLQNVGFPITHQDRAYGKRFWTLAPHFLERGELMLSPTEMVSLYLARELLAPLAGTPFGDGAGEAVEKIRAMLPKDALVHFEDLEETLHVKSVAHPDYSGVAAEIRALNQAILAGRVCRVRYHSASKGREWTAAFHPYGLVHFGTNLYAVGYLEPYEEVRTLKVSRVQAVQATDRRFERPADFSLQAYVDGSFGVFAAGALQTLEIRFTGWAATNVREHRWHPSQEIVTDTGKAVTARFRLSDTREFKRWLLGYGRHAVVLKPAVFRLEMRDEICTACDTYAGKDAAACARRPHGPAVRPG